MIPVEDEIRQFITENFLFGAEDRILANDASLLESGIVDSTGVLEIVAFLTTKYGVEIGPADVLPSNFDSIGDMVRFLDRKLGDAATAAR
jgi:acyl carrier protein